VAALSYQRIEIAGLDVVHANADPAGDLVPGDDRGFLVVTNGSTAAVTVTVAVPGRTRFGLLEPDVDVSVPANDVAFIGPMSRGLVNAEANGVEISYSAAASVTVAAVVV
jgi:hypothetical protein